MALLRTLAELRRALDAGGLDDVAAMLCGLARPPAAIKPGARIGIQRLSCHRALAAVALCSAVSGRTMRL